MMDRGDYLVSGDELKCSCGTESSNLKVTVNRGLYIGDNLAATMADNLPMINVGCFGKCMANQKAPKPCMFNGFWMDASKKITICDFPALTKNSALICNMGPGVVVARNNEKVQKRYTTILEKKNGMDKIRDKRREFLDEMEISETDIDNCHDIYLKSVEYKLRQEKEFKDNIIRQLDENGINRDWYSLEGDEDKYLSYKKGGHIKTDYGKRIIYCKDSEITVNIVNALLRYKKEYEFEQGIINTYVDILELEVDEMGSFDGVDEKEGKLKFRMYVNEDPKTSDKKRLEKDGYYFSSYDYYQGYDVYMKLMDISSVKNLIVRYKYRDEVGNVQEESKIILLPEELQDEIVDWIKNTGNMVMGNYELCEKVEKLCL